jgi:Na+:H+ antiporter, NhaA family
MNKQKDPTIIGGLLEPFQRFFKVEASGGIVLLIFTLIAMIWANSPWSENYFTLWENKLTIGIGDFHLSKTLLHWINDGLMAIFFFVVGLEIKREMIAGELSTLKKASLPIIAALGGMIIPAVLYLMLNRDPAAEHGWGIPMATDIAFSLGILSLLGKRVPLALKVFLVAFAIVDDLGAVLIIALFYSEDLQWNYLLIGLGLVLLLVVFNRLQVISVHPYMVVGWIIWFLFLKSGIHPTIAGVMIAFTIPVNRVINLKTFKTNMQDNLDYFYYDPESHNKITLTYKQLAAISNMENMIFHVQSPVQRLEHALHGFVTFVVMPLFALANAGVILMHIHPAEIFSGLSGTIEFSLIAGKVLGIFVFSWLSVKLGIARLPDNIQWKHILSIGFLGGMGFTMSLFIVNLAFTSEALLNPAKIGILVGSLIAGLGGYIMLALTLKKK